MILNKNNFTKDERDLEDLVNRLTSILIDPLAIELTKKVEWWKLTGLSNITVSFLSNKYRAPKKKLTKKAYELKIPYINKPLSIPSNLQGDNDIYA